jgi:predicted DNA-binding transcriptional regulator AlpA
MTGTDELRGYPMKEKEEDKEGKRRLLNVNETAEYLGLSARTIYNGSHKKSKKPFPVRPKRIGRVLRWDRRELDAWVESL